MSDKSTASIREGLVPLSPLLAVFWLLAYFLLPFSLLSPLFSFPSFCFCLWPLVTITVVLSHQLVMDKILLLILALNDGLYHNTPLHQLWKLSVWYKNRCNLLLHASVFPLSV